MRWLCLLVAALISGPALAEIPARAPAEGLAILDCAPSLPAPQASCLLRVPPGIERGNMSSTQGKFTKVGDLSALIPGVSLSSTVVLIDLTPGIGGERRATWARERALISDFLGALPSGERIALYGFNESLERLSDFGTDRAAQQAVIAGLELRGTNTRIATYARDAINVLGAQDKTILRNLVVISDGEEEGTRDIAEVSAAAVAQGVAVSALGMLWRPVGAPENGAGMDYLSKLTEQTHGISRAVQIRREAEAPGEVRALAADLGKAISASGLVVPEGAPVAADISVVLRHPAAGAADQFSEETVTAHFAGAATSEAPAEEVPAPAAGWLEGALFGVPKLWWLIGGGGLVLVLGALGLALRKRDPEPDDVLQAQQVEPLLPVSALAPEALAWLVREDTGERFAIRKARVTIGRAAGCDVVVVNPSVSRSHAELAQGSGEHFTVTDSGSLNKTRLNGRVISAPQVLSPGDVVSVGEVKLRFTKV